eukprot:gene13365-biopygen8215
MRLRQMKPAAGLEYGYPWWPQRSVSSNRKLRSTADLQYWIKPFTGDAYAVVFCLLWIFPAMLVMTSSGLHTGRRGSSWLRGLWPKQLQVREKSGRSPEEVWESLRSPQWLGALEGAGTAQSPLKSGKSPGKVRNGLGPLCEDNPDSRFGPMTEEKSKEDAQTRGGQDKVRKSPEHDRGKSGKVRKLRKVWKEFGRSPGESGMRQALDFK